MQNIVNFQINQLMKAGGGANQFSGNQMKS